MCKNCDHAKQWHFDNELDRTTKCMGTVNGKICGCQGFEEER